MGDYERDTARQMERRSSSQEFAFLFAFWAATLLQLYVTYKIGWRNSISEWAWSSIVIILVIFGLNLKIAWWKIVIFAVLSVFPLGSLFAFPYYKSVISSVNETTSFREEDPPEPKRKRPKGSRGTAQKDPTPKRPKKAASSNVSQMLMEKADDLSWRVWLYSIKRFDNYPGWLTPLYPEDSIEWRRFVVAASVFVAVLPIPAEYHQEFISRVQSNLENKETGLTGCFEDCKNFCRQYMNHIPVEYGDERWADLMAAWGALRVFKRKFARIDELGSLREICADIIVNFSNWWDGDSMNMEFNTPETVGSPSR